MKNLQEALDGSNVPDIAVLKKDLHDLLEQENTRWMQTFKQLWLKDSDRNTKYFHASAKQRNQRSRMVRISDEGGCQWETEEDIGNAFLTYFGNLYTSERGGTMGPCLMGLEGRVSTAMNSKLLKDFSKEEIKVRLS